MEKIRMLREAQGMTQQGMSEALSVDRSTVAKWELADTYPRPKFLPLIAALLNCTIDDLYREENA